MNIYLLKPWLSANLKFLSTNNPFKLFKPQKINWNLKTSFISFIKMITCNILKIACVAFINFANWNQLFYSLRETFWISLLLNPLLNVVLPKRRRFWMFLIIFQNVTAVMGFETNLVEKSSPLFYPVKRNLNKSKIAIPKRITMLWQNHDISLTYQIKKRISFLKGL